MDLQLWCKKTFQLMAMDYTVCHMMMYLKAMLLSKEALRLAQGNSNVRLSHRFC